MKKISGKRIEKTGQGEIRSLMVSNGWGIFSSIRLFRALETVRPHLDKTKVVLDVGCGDGIFLSNISEKIKRGVGIDLDPHPPKVALERDNLDFLTMNIDEIKSSFFNDFDVITCFEVLEHLKKPEKFLQKIRKSNFNGPIIVSIPHKDHLQNRLRRIFKFGEDIPKAHYREYQFAEIKQIFEGFEILSIRATHITFPFSKHIDVISRRYPLLLRSKMMIKFYSKIFGFAPKYSRGFVIELRKN